MRRVLFAFLLFAIPFTTSGAFAGLATENDRDEMIRNLDVIRNSFHVQYAPAEWKRQYAGWDLDEKIDEAKKSVRTAESLSVKDFQKIVLDLFKSTKDYHVGVTFHSTEIAMLPFSVKKANGNYFITYIDRSKLSELSFPFNVGDELIAFDGKPVEETIQEIKGEYMGSASELTDHSQAEIFLTCRVRALGHDVPSGPVFISVKPQGRNIVSNYQLIWDYTPEKVISKGLDSFITKPEGSSGNRLVDSLMSKEMMAPFYKVLANIHQPKFGDDAKTTGSRKSSIPTLGKLWWMSDEECPFHAYIFEASDRSLVGYVRIPHYVAGDAEAREFAAIMMLFQERTDALIIDQINNPGGSVFYLYTLASMLTDQPLYTPKHRLAISQADVMEAVDYIEQLEAVKSDADAVALLGDNLGGTPITYQMSRFLLNYFRFIVSEWNAERTLTNPYYLYGIDHINPNPYVQYTKPVLLLTNELDFSGGDFFPAIMQDNGRAVILGERTAGAGGCVTGIHHPNLFGIAGYRYTCTIAERIDKQPIENLGVEPDIHYSLTENDLRYNYYDYANKIHEVVDQLLHD